MADDDKDVVELFGWVKKRVGAAVVMVAEIAQLERAPFHARAPH
jgi:hypothetical protein